MRRNWILGVLALLVVAVPALAADPVIFKGIDPWWTTPNGASFSDFKSNPIPAGFFCQGSEPFTGRVHFRGRPLAIAEQGRLKGVDTIVERLDDAVFDAQGVALTRVKVRALSLVSVEPIKTRCGSFQVYMTLAGEQRVTTMRIVRESDTGGRFFAPIAVDARFTFQPVGSTAVLPREFRASVNFPALGNAPWASPVAKVGAAASGPLTVDTNGDRKPDTQVAGTSNFLAGATVDPLRNYPLCDTVCHCDSWDGSCQYHLHCTQNCYGGCECPILAE
ncbi:MAG TPA: hypothetical protein PK413_01775 [Thermoanaerobaculia bacterium]|nr:hypothetical protein [Thermoanaerobaculia bacterium]